MTIKKLPLSEIPKDLVSSTVVDALNSVNSDEQSQKDYEQLIDKKEEISHFNLDIHSSKHCFKNSPLKQCCCNCEYSLKVLSHCSYIKLPHPEHSCGCNQPLGFHVCILSHTMDNSNTCQILPEHSLGCECYSPKTEKLNKLYITLGDISNNNKSEKILIESNFNYKQLQTAYLNSCKKTNIYFHHSYVKNSIDICIHFDQSQLTKKIFNSLNKLNCPFNDMEFDTNDIALTEDNCERYYFNTKSYINTLMWFIGLSTPSPLIWKKIKDDTPSFNNHIDSTIKLGYGLFD